MLKILLLYFIYLICGRVKKISPSDDLAKIIKSVGEKKYIFVFDGKYKIDGNITIPKNIIMYLATGTVIYGEPRSTIETTIF